MRRIRVAVLGALIGTTLTFPPPASAADPVVCGQLITTDLVLQNDVLDCPGNGLVVDADDVTIDLNGHVVDSSGVIGEEDRFAGILNVGHDGLTVRNGTIREFVEGVLTIGGDGLQVDHLSTTLLLHTAVYVDSGSGAVIQDNRSVDDCAGAVLEGSTDARVQRNTVLDHGCAGIAIYSSTQILVRDNVMRSTRPREALSGESAGIDVTAGSTDVLVVGNQVSDQGFVGLFIDGANRNRLVDNVIGHNNLGIVVMGHRNLVRGNWVSDVGACANACGFGISVEGGRANVIADNTVTRTAAAGIRVTYYPRFTPPVVRTMLRRNVVTDAATDGVLVAHRAAWTSVVGNRVSGNADDGIDVNAETARVRGNTAARNRDLGIEARAGVVDGGSNRGRSNGDRRQCTGVSC